MIDLVICIRFMNAFSQSASNHGSTTCFGVAEDLGTVSSAIEIKVSVKPAMALGLLWMSAVSLTSQRVRKECQSAFFSLQPPAWFSSASSWSLMVDYDREVVTPTEVVQYSPREILQQIGVGYCEIYCCVGSVPRM